MAIPRSLPLCATASQNAIFKGYALSLDRMMVFSWEKLGELEIGGCCRWKFSLVADRYACVLVAWRAFYVVCMPLYTFSNMCTVLTPSCPLPHSLLMATGLVVLLVVEALIVQLICALYQMYIVRKVGSPSLFPVVCNAVFCTGARAGPDLEGPCLHGLHSLHGMSS